MSLIEPPAATGALPVDIATMRANVAQVLPPEVTPTDRATLETLTEMLRGHMQLLIPEIEQAAAELPADDVPRYCALVSVGEARMKLNARPGRLPYDAVAYVRRLGRSLLALCDHYETLTGARMCLACDQPIRPGEATRPYGQASPSGGASFSGRIHGHCANAVRIR
ncbi:DUF6415 family natural product biosynthesis protein [Streptomyces sp. P17]|uniref:DUF6415 family natural product biosynthesis protein n=1 Tax=Streptomyces sp. P17 TaxID=3074716 RepID=UPI0028F41D58|nr:DUF6415 family natural product biosynthesis protein [Streptomyces sp. P17]MDT9695379.1 DUF6415 family natural product biosynthesis protein [Streptomyces sp. P17]